MHKFNMTIARTSAAPLLVLTLGLAGCASTPEITTPNSAAREAAKAPSKGILARVFETTKPVTLPDGTVIAVTLNQSLSSATSRGGEEFSADVTEPVIVDGKTVIPHGAHATGRVVEAKSSGRLHDPGRLELALTSVEVGGTRYTLHTGDTRSVGKGHMKHNLIFIGGGSAAGALLGGILGGGKGAAIGAGAGAGGGTAVAAATGKMEVSLPAETRLRFPLVEPVSIKVKN